MMQMGYCSRVREGADMTGAGVVVAASTRAEEAAPRPRAIQ